MRGALNQIAITIIIYTKPPLDYVFICVIKENVSSEPRFHTQRRTQHLYILGKALASTYMHTQSPPLPNGI